MTTETTALAVSGKLNDSLLISRAIVKSGMFPGIREASQAIVKVLAGQELGFGPMYSMMKIHFIKGQLALSAEAMGALIKRSDRYDYKVKALTDTECVITFLDKGQAVYESRWTVEDTKRAGLSRDDSGWQKFPRAMLMARALSQGARIVCPHIIGGAYTPEEFGYEVNADGTVLNLDEFTPEQDEGQQEQKAEDKPAEKKGHWCPVHKVAFKRFEKEGREWYSHGIKGTSPTEWCKETQPVSPAGESPGEDESAAGGPSELIEDISEAEFRDALKVMGISLPAINLGVLKCQSEGIMFRVALEMAKAKRRQKGA